MKLYNFLLIIAIFTNFIIACESISLEKQGDEKVEWCYCSFKCGPRKVKPDDAPFYDEEYGLCFCKQRDQDYYIKNGCNKKSKPEFISYCDNHSKE